MVTASLFWSRGLSGTFFRLCSEDTGFPTQQISSWKVIVTQPMNENAELEDDCGGLVSMYEESISKCTSVTSTNPLSGKEMQGVNLDHSI